MKKTGLEFRSTNYCKHGHTYLEHPACYGKEQNERIGFLDIEASNLDANFGIMLSYCIKDSQSKKIYEGVISKKDLEGDLDKRLIRKCIDDLANFDRIVTFYGARFDMPFIRTRALINNIDFYKYGAINHTDAWFIARGKLKLNSNRLKTVSQAVLGKTNKTEIEPIHWIKGLQGDTKSLKYILEHNRWDVLDLEEVYYKLRGFVRRTNSSI